MNSRILIHFIWFILCSQAIQSQQINFARYTVQEGLVANPVRCIYQDSKGFIWIGTFDGLSRYDGYKFTNYTAINGLSHSFINTIIEVDGKLLIGENNGATDVIENNILIKKTLNASSAVNIISKHNNRVILSTDAEGFLEYRHDSLISPRQPQPQSSLGHFISINDSLFLSDGVDDELFLLRNDFTVISKLIIPGAHFYSLVKDSKKRIWACTSAGLKLLDIRVVKNELTISVITVPSIFDFEPLRNGAVTSFIEQEDGSTWMGTMKGLVRLMPDGKYHVYNEKDGLPSATIYSLYSDKEKNLWIGTSLGLAKWVSKNNVIFFNTESQDFRNDVFAITSSGHQKIVLRTDHGLQSFNLSTREFKNIEVPHQHYPIPVAGTSPLLVQYGNQVGVLDAAKNKVVPKTVLDTAITGAVTAYRHPNGIIFLGTFSGVFAIHKSGVKKILGSRITSMTIDPTGHIWAGTWTDGLFRITTRDEDEQEYDVVDMTGKTKQKEIRGLFTDSKKNIWVGTRYGGAFCLAPQPNDDYDVRQFNRQSGLISDWVISFAETKTGDIWIGTYLGLDKLVNEASGFRVFNFSKAINFFAEIKKIIPANDYWVCVANSGIALFKDESLHDIPPLHPVIFSASLGLRENNITVFSPADKITLKPFQNAARFEFGALGFVNEKQVLYSYRLKGSGDTGWSTPQNIHEATYASLSPGEYSFEVKTIGWNGEEGIPAAFSFHIKTPFWNQWWFLTLIIAAVLLLLFIFYRYRINQLLRLQRVRNNIATDLHDDIGSSLTNISILSELSSKNILQPEKAQPFLQRISEEVQASSQAMDDIIWSVNSHNDSLQETMARMRRYAAELFDNSDIECHLQLDEKAGGKKLSMEQRRDVYLIYKEALNNIHKHAAARNVWVRVAQNHNHLLMQIKDDGKGFNTDFITHRNGLKNLRSRTEKWNGKIEIDSKTGKGTTIDIKIPLKE